MIMNRFQTKEGLADGAALALCESLVLGLIESGKLEPCEVHVAIEEAVRSLDVSAAGYDDPGVVRAAARLLERLAIGTNLEAAQPIAR